MDRILEAAGQRPDSRQLMRAALEQLREWTGCEAAAIRLEEAGDYPYVIEQGFPASYLVADNSLLARGPDRSLLRDDEGRPVLECACGDIIRGRTPADHPRFSAEGTFWTGSTSEAAVYDDRDESLSRLRGRCKQGGYESVACFPLRAHGEVFGILQLNSARKHLITPEVLSVVEPAVAAFALRLRELLADEVVRSHESLHEALSAAMVEAFAYCRLYYDEVGAPSDWAYVAVNSAFLDLFGITDPIAKRNSQVMPGEQELARDILDVFGRVVVTRRPERLERYLPGRDKWLAMRVSSPAPDHLLLVCEDITARRQIEERLRRMQYAIDTMADLYPIWLDPEARIVEVSESTCRHLGYSREELLAMTIFDVDPTLTQANWQTSWASAMAHGHHTVESQHRTKSGRTYPVEVSIDFVAFGGRQYSCGFCRDITERKQIEERLWRTQVSVDSMNDYLMWLDSEARIVDVSESTCRQLEYSREELLRMSVLDVDPYANPERLRAGWSRLAQSGHETHQAQHRTKSGRVYPVEVSLHYVSFGGKEYSCSFCRDISERRQVEEKLQRAQFFLDHVDDYPMWTDVDARIVDVSDTTCRRLGYTREELLSMTVFDIDPNLVRDEWAAQWEARRELGPRVFETEHRTKSGSFLPVEAVITRVEFGGQEYDCGMLRDISDRRQLEEKLQRTQFTVDNMSDYLIWGDADGHTVDVSESTCRHLEYSREELLSLTPFDFDPDVTPERWVAHQDRMRNLDTETVETRHRTKSGRMFPVEVIISKVIFGGKEYHCSFCRDITERRHVEEKLRRAQFALDHVSDYPMWVDSEARIVEVSDSTCRYLEYSREELLSMSVYDLDPNMTPERWEDHWRKIRESGFRTIVAQHRTKSGNLLPIEIASTHVSFGGQEYDCDFCRDISERKRLEESLRLNQLTVEQSPEMVLWINKDGSLAYANESASKITGRSLEDLRELRVWDLDPSVSPDSWNVTWQRTREQGPFRQEGLVRSADGRIRPVEISSSHVDFEGREYGVAFVRDIEERKRAEQVLRDSEERYHQLFELESDAIVLTDDVSGQILDANAAASQLFGYTKEELVALNSAALLVEPEPARVSTGELDTGVVLRWNRKKDGTLFPAEVRHRYFELEGREVRVAVVRDVTERLRAEEELLESRQMLQLVLDTVPLRIVWKDRDLRYMGCNMAMALDLRLPDPSAITGMAEDDLPSGPRSGVPHSARADDLEVIRTGIPKLQYEETTAPVEGSPRIIRTSKVPLRDAAGEVIGLLAVHEDVTERAMTLRALRERDEQLRHSQKMEAVGRLAGGIAHDFNNVLTTIIGYSDLILGSPEGGSGSVAEDVREIKAAAERASALTRQILAFSRRQSLRPEVLSLNKIVSDIERMLARTIGADVRLTTVLDPDLGLVDVDEHQFVQIMLNLAVNARDAMPQGGTLTVVTANVDLDEAFCRTHPDAQPGSYVMVAVSDTGTGMDDETKAHVFEPFYTTKATGEGTGLGLATVYGVVAQSGGYTYVESELGRGTTFTIYLPRVRSTPGEQTRGFRPAGLGALETILVVDDDDAFRALTVRILEKRGFRAIPASDGDQAVEILQNPDIEIDLLLTDIVMPGSLQGGQVGQIAAGLRPGLPILYMSSYSRDTIEKVGTFQGVLDYLEKPFTADSLVQRIQTALGRNQADVPRT